MSWLPRRQDLRVATRSTGRLLVSLLVATGALGVGVPAEALASGLVHPSAASTCPLRDLALSAGPAGTGHQHGYTVYRLTNIARVTCDLRSYPGIRLERPGGKPAVLRVHDTSRRGTVSPAVSVRQEAIRPGATVSFWVEWFVRSGHKSGSMQVFPPGQAKPITVENRTIVLDAGILDVSPVTSRWLTS